MVDVVQFNGIWIGFGRDDVDGLEFLEAIADGRPTNVRFDPGVELPE